jgi:hypothetical protein
VNARTLRTIPEILAYLGASTLEDADAEYWRRVDAFRGTDIAANLSRHWERVKAIATGLSSAEAQALEDALGVWRRAQPLDPEYQRRERERMAELTGGSQICGHCGRELPDMYALVIHEGNCSYAPELRVNVADLVR